VFWIRAPSAEGATSAAGRVVFGEFCHAHFCFVRLEFGVTSVVQGWTTQEMCRVATDDEQDILS